ncbi:MAG: efflux RND transporter permease subunit [Sulfurovum sp.]|nr:efflux RND transporter permease subunit [Sulfurovum sp.]
MVVHNIEDEVKSLSAISTIYSSIQNGSFRIQADIKSGEDAESILADVKDIISKTRRDLPSDMDEPLARILVQDYPLLLIAISGDIDKKDLIKAGNDLKSRLALLGDLSSIDLRGGTEEEVVIQLDQKKLDAYDLDKLLVYQAIANISSIFPLGTLDAQGEHLYISTINGEKDAQSLGNTLLQVGTKHFRLKDIATVSYSLADPTEISHYNAKPNLSLNINKSKEGNAIALSKEIKTILLGFNDKYEGIEFKVYTDTSVWIKNRLNLVSSNILFGLILVFLALLLSVNIRIALVVAIGIPMSFMIALIMSDMLDYSLNMLSLLGALIALGMLVDEAIVVAENIYRHMEMGKSARDASIDGALEMFPAVLTATLTTIFAFLPLLLMSGKMGVFMQILPIMLSILLLSSLFEAFYFLPLHAKELFGLKPIKKETQKTGMWSRWLVGYTSLLLFLLCYKKTSLFLLVTLIIMATIGMGKLIKFQLFPEFDAQQIYMNGTIDINNNLRETEVYVSEIEEALLDLLQDQDMDSVTSVIGFKLNKDQSFEVGENRFQIFINLHEKAAENFFEKYINPIFSLEYDDSDMIRHRVSQDIAKEIEEKIVQKFRNQMIDGKKLYEEFNVYVQQAGIVSNDIEIGLEHTDKEKILDAIQRVEEKLSNIEGVKDIANNANIGERELKLRINHYGQSLGFSEGYLASVLKGAFLKSEYSKMFNAQGLMRVKIEDVYKDHTSKIGNFELSTPDGKRRVRLSEICDFTYHKSFVKIFKENGNKVRTVVANVEKKVITSIDAMKDLAPLLETLEQEGLKVSIKGEAKENNTLKKEMGEALVLAVFLIFITLVWMFNSLVLPLIILSIIPLTLLGALLGTYIMGIHMTMPGMMGVVGLAGVVVNDGLIMLDFIRKGDNYTKLSQYAGMRLRPIILTSVTTVLGLSSLMFFASGQALILQPMAISLGFGIAWATILNLYYVPLMYAVVYRIGEKI